MNRLLKLSPLVSVVLLNAFAVWQCRSAAEWRELAYEGAAIATTCREQLKQQISDCTEDINERSKLSNEIATQFCRERDAGCLTLVSLMRKSDGSYECRCR